MSVAEEQTQKPVIEDRIYIGNVDYKATQEELKAFFEEFKVVEVDIPSKTLNYGKKSIERHLGFAFVEFESKEDADKAIEKFNGQKFKGRSIYIKKAVPPPTEEEKQKKVEAYKAKKAELKKAAVEKKATKQKEIKAKKAAEKAKSDSSDSTDAKGAKEEKEPKDKVPEGNPSKDTIFITNLDYKVDVQTLSNVFRDLKPKWIYVPTVKVPYWVLKSKRNKGKPVHNKGIAFVKFSSEEVQKKAVAEFNGKEINDREIIVDIAIDTRVNEEEIKQEESSETTEEKA